MSADERRDCKNFCHGHQTSSPDTNFVAHLQQWFCMLSAFIGGCSLWLLRQPAPHYVIGLDRQQRRLQLALVERLGTAWSESAARRPRHWCRHAPADRGEPLERPG